jgi:glyoxylase-like metal-dependent hydrolase (beta-lactamase superfamily II)
MSMISLGPDLQYFDLDYLGVPSVIATAVLEGPAGVALVDPGPGVSAPALRAALATRGLRVADVTALLLTHIHLDHAGATGTLVRENPRIEVFVHERGARHMIDPAKLLDSATRLYGDDMGRLWGEFLPVPAGNVRALGGGERIDAGGRTLEVAYTPGHASHHVSYFDSRSGVVFVGDTAGGRIGASTYVMPPTPPPDIDLDMWRASAGVILAWSPATLFLTHFGPSATEPRAHMRELLDRLQHSADLARQALAAGGSDQEQALRFRDEMRAELRRHMSEGEAAAYELAIPFDHCFLGLARYWRKRAADAQV